MRMQPSQYLKLRNPRGTPVLAKGRPAGKVAHFSAPLKGLSRFAELNEADPLLASILINWIVEDDRITVRPGYLKIGQITGNPPISTLIPHYSTNDRLAAAAGGKIYDTAGTQIAAGPYGSDDWAWTSFSDLGTADYTVMVNGVNGVVSWNGLTTFTTETLTAPAGETWVDPTKFDKVISHMNRLWFADSVNLAVYYLPIQQKSGALELLPLDALFTRGGKIVAMCTWSIDGGRGLDDAIVIFTSNGEVAIYSGVDPGGADFKLVGVFRFDSPMSKTSVMGFGGDVYVMVSSGFVPLTTLIRSETEQLGKSDQNVLEEFQRISRSNGAIFGWQVLLNSQTGHAICNMPLGNGEYQQMVRKMPGQIWSKWHDIPARCWGWLDNHAYFGSDDGGIYIGGREYLNDDGTNIEADVRFAWSSFKTPSKKHFKLIRLYTITDGQMHPYLDMDVDYSNVPPTNRPDPSFGPSGGADWNTSDWNTADWAVDARPKMYWQGVTGLGRVGAPRIRVSVGGAVLSIMGVDVIYEVGGLL